MVNSSATLTAIFSALADPTRRRILEILKAGESRITDLAANFKMSLPAVSKHLRILEDAGLLLRTRDGRVHRMRANPRGLDGARQWVNQYVEFWDKSFDALERFLEQDDTEKKQ